MQLKVKEQLWAGAQYIIEDTNEIPQTRSTIFPRTKRRTDEEQTITKQTPHMKPPMHKPRRITTEEPPWSGQKKNYSRLSLSRIPRDSLKCFKISVHRHISFAEFRGKKWIEQQHLTNVYVIWLLKLEIYWKYCGKEEKLLLRSNFSSFPQYFVTCC